jgi:Transaldolase/Fructose-6-phosphate aldolase
MARLYIRTPICFGRCEGVVGTTASSKRSGSQAGTSVACDPEPGRSSSAFRSRSIVFSPRDLHPVLFMTRLPLKTCGMPRTFYVLFLRRAAGPTVSLASNRHRKQLTADTQGTIEEARRLHRIVNRPNLMIKVVATKDGVTAVEALIAEGISINITLIFSLRHYEAVAAAYIRGLQRCKSPDKVSSVPSFFVSRVDTQEDKALSAIGSPEALALRGKIAIANAKAMYRRFPIHIIRSPLSHVIRLLAWMFIELALGRVSAVLSLVLGCFILHGRLSDQKQRSRLPGHLFPP